jgi:hypothetical protein
MGIDFMYLLSLLSKTRSNVARLKWIESELEAELERRGGDVEVVSALREVQSKIAKAERRTKGRKRLGRI